MKKKKSSFLANFLNEEQTLCIKKVKFENSKLKSPTSLHTSVLFFQHDAFSKGRCNLEASKVKIKLQTFFNKLVEEYQTQTKVSFIHLQSKRRQGWVSSKQLRKLLISLLESKSSLTLN